MAIAQLYQASTTQMTLDGVIFRRSVLLSGQVVGIQSPFIYLAAQVGSRDPPKAQKMAIQKLNPGTP